MFYIYIFLTLTELRVYLHHSLKLAKLANDIHNIIVSLMLASFLKTGSIVLYYSFMFYVLCYPLTQQSWVS